MLSVGVVAHHGHLEMQDQDEKIIVNASHDRDPHSWFIQENGHQDQE
jgi:hypothetical protein